MVTKQNLHVMKALSSYHKWPDINVKISVETLHLLCY